MCRGGDANHALRTGKIDKLDDMFRASTTYDVFTSTHTGFHDCEMIHALERFVQASCTRHGALPFHEMIYSGDRTDFNGRLRFASPPRHILNSMYSTFG